MTSARVHSRYLRRLVDSAIGGREVLVALQVRRFFCGHLGARKTFAEQVAGPLRIGSWSLTVLLALLLAGGWYGGWSVRRPFPTHDGELRLRASLRR